MWGMKRGAWATYLMRVAAQAAREKRPDLAAVLMVVAKATEAGALAELRATLRGFVEAKAREEVT